MAENLAYKPSSGNYWAYDNNQSNVAKYGYLYDWQTACNVCPTGWHLPSDTEWTQLTEFVGGKVGTKLKAKSGWSRNGNGTDDYGFYALPGGARDGWYGSFYSIGLYSTWWSSSVILTKKNLPVTDLAWRRYMVSHRSNVSRSDTYEGWGLSVRCVRD
jgi:uncharacterized protein (TIGR02145 family)